MNDIIRQSVRAYTRCPYCNSTGSSKIVLNLGNAVRGLVNLLIGLVAGEPAFPLSLLWKCRFCGAKFRVNKRIDPSQCRICDYDLTGNVSGTCPECGAPIDASKGKQEKGRVQRR